MTFDEFFAVVAGGAERALDGAAPPAPYAYQRQLASEAWPDMLDIPTGMGKTVAITAAWLYRRLERDEPAPRRLVWCLPMRVLVEQTRSNVETWLERVAPLFHERGIIVPRVWVLMGGEAQHDWADRPEDPAVLIGTQDMVLSRALMRGYGASRYRWPVDFALLHNDALWVFDEVQPMGAGLSTSARLEAFRRHPGLPTVLPSRTIWSSATLHSKWFDTVDFRAHLPGCRVLQMPEEDRQDARVQKRFSAPKHVVAAQARLAGSRKAEVKACIDLLVAEVVDTHRGDAPTLVIVNRVARAQDVFRGLRTRLQSTHRQTTVLLWAGRRWHVPTPALFSPRAGLDARLASGGLAGASRRYGAARHARERRFGSERLPDCSASRQGANGSSRATRGDRAVR